MTDNTEGDHTTAGRDVHRRGDGVVVVRENSLIECITPPEGTDVRAVQWSDDPAPVVVGKMVVR